MFQLQPYWKMTVLSNERNNNGDTPQIAGISHDEVSTIPSAASDDNVAQQEEAVSSHQSNIHYDLMPTTTNAAAAAAAAHVVSTAAARQAAEEVDDDEEESEMIRKWKESPFAIGLTKATWADDDIGCTKTCLACCNGSKHSHVYCTACICGRLGTGRVGNMIVLRQTMEEVEVMDAENGGEGNNITSRISRRSIRRPRLRCVVGPYWMITFCLVVPFFAALSFLVARRLANSEDLHLAVLLVWIIITTGLFCSLFLVACSDPGIHYRHSTRPTNSRDDGDDWIWNDQALSYRPQHAKFDPEVQCIVNHFDHVCPWTSTAIGGGNILWFYMFLVCVLGTLMYDIILLTFFGQ